VDRPVNRQLVGLAASQPFAAYTLYLDLYASFVDANGRQLGEHFNDGLHPSESGYRVWRDRLVPFLRQVRQESENDRPPGNS
jgi:lysophospholipase L1-like esterase